MPKVILHVIETLRHEVKIEMTDDELDYLQTTTDPTKRNNRASEYTSDTTIQSDTYELTNIQEE